jgi:hypothetical protein
MSTKSDYTPEEWQLLTGIPWAVGLAVVLAEDKGGRKAIAKELAALASAPEQVAATMINNQLIQSALPDVLVSPAADKIKAHSREKGDIERTIYQDTYRLCQQVATTLKAKSTADESAGYKRFIIEVGRAVAEAVADAEYLGIGGGTVSSYERKLLQALSVALELEAED